MFYLMPSEVAKSCSRHSRVVVTMSVSNNLLASQPSHEYLSHRPTVRKSWLSRVGVSPIKLWLSSNMMTKWGGKKKKWHLKIRSLDKQLLWILTIRICSLSLSNSQCVCETQIVQLALPLYLRSQLTKILLHFWKNKNEAPLRSTSWRGRAWELNSKTTDLPWNRSEAKCSTLRSSLSQGADFPLLI